MTEPSFLRTTRTAYDTVAADYAELLKDELARKPYDLAMLGVFAGLVRAVGNGPVADLGCGPGRVTAHLDSLGLDAFGIDLSPEMISVARRTHPHLRFEEGTITALELADESLAGALAWYSIIHTPPELLPGVFAEFHRVLMPGAPLLLAFQVGDERAHLRDAYGHRISLDAYRLPPEKISELVGEAGLTVDARLVRAAAKPEKTPQAYLMARKPMAS
ncbi:class I SAM-dependent methyltransferase [Amycolatopsis cynarae]|uniref:Class I SAM-dependent methyltransferase n=1 Tax=Amycolatopsis cynarae TaxID=2995223 RepID=A0ABY7B324_9PSEU|nr:class I SAM-dependent methyltransferase [Amycolatopsis sp. HUAS 11-8]WAL65844.1 class I SAM-dependent methyltransferase [Amycolatopsis sp. HUAS 11-8]